MEDWMLGPPLLVGERVAHVAGDDPCLGTVRWLGRLNGLFGRSMVAGVFLDEPQILGTCDGSFGSRQLFRCHPNHGKFIPVGELVKEEVFFTVLARQRETRSSSRASSVTGHGGSGHHYVNTQHAQGPVPTYQNHSFGTSRHPDQRMLYSKDRRASRERDEFRMSRQDVRASRDDIRMSRENIRFPIDDISREDMNNRTSFRQVLEARENIRHVMDGRENFRQVIDERENFRQVIDPRENIRQVIDARENIRHVIDPRENIVSSHHVIDSHRDRLPFQPVIETVDLYQNDHHHFVDEIQDAEIEPNFAHEVLHKTSSARNPFRSREVNVTANFDKLTQPGLNTFRAMLKDSQVGVECQQLLQELEFSIEIGDHKKAAHLAKVLANLKIASRLTEQENKANKKQTSAEKLIKVNMFVEDKVSAQGPIVVTVNPDITVADLKQQIENEFEIPVKLQKWILGKSLVSQDDAILSSQGVTQEGMSIFLYLEEAPKKDNNDKTLESVAKALSTPASKQNEVIQEKGKYWNYEEDRWSFCYSDDEEDNEREKTIAQIAKEVIVDAVDPEADDEVEGDYEWEYFYEDIPEKPKLNNNDFTDGPKLPFGAPINKIVEKGEAKKVQTDQDDPLQNAVTNLKIASKAATIASGTIIQTKGDTEKTKTLEEKKGDEPGSWQCANCTLTNSADRPGCAACANEKPVDADATKNIEVKQVEKKNETLNDIRQLDNLDIIPNADTFECVVCFLDIEPGDGVVLRECLHTFCKFCLSAAVEYSETPKVKCPYKDDNYSCEMDLLDREIKALVPPNIYEKHINKSLKTAQSTTKNVFHCKTPDCEGWTVTEDDINLFKCPLCKRNNCITCQDIHDGMDCKQFQQYTLNEATDENVKKTKLWIDGLITSGEALHCPSCQVLLLKKWGCDWVRCSYCRTEICWVTKQLRWGPNGRGDTSGGCKCLADGRTKCHKLCNYCH